MSTSSTLFSNSFKLPIDVVNHDGACNDDFSGWSVFFDYGVVWFSYVVFVVVFV